MIKKLILLAIVAISGCGFLPSGESPDMKAIKRLEERKLMLKPSIACFAAAGRGFWGGEAKYNARVALTPDGVAINSDTEWDSRYLFAGDEYLISDVDLKNGMVEVHAWKEPEWDVEIVFTFPGPPDFFRAFWAVFFAEEEDYRAYQAATDEAVISDYIDKTFSGIDVPADAKRTLSTDLQAFARLSRSNYPKLQREPTGYFVPIGLADNLIYNTVQVSKNQRIASTLDRLMPQAKRLVAQINPTSGLLRGYSFWWIVYYQNFLERGSNRYDVMELIVERPAFDEFMAGNYSIYEMVQKSTLRVNSEKYTLTSYDPIGE